MTPIGKVCVEIMDERYRQTLAIDVSWAPILLEEVGEALQAKGPDLRKELLQVAAVCVAWIEAIDRREHGE